MRSTAVRDTPWRHGRWEDGGKAAVERGPVVTNKYTVDLALTHVCNNAGSLRRLYATPISCLSSLNVSFGQKFSVFIENGLQSSEVQCLSARHNLTHPQN